jgi:hypothetical protein
MEKRFTTALIPAQYAATYTVSQRVMHNRFIVTLVSNMLLLTTLFWTMLNSSLIWSRYSKAPGITLFRDGTHIIAELAAISFFIAAAIIGIVAALQPASRWRKLLLVLPTYLLGVLLTGVLLYFLQIGTLGSFTKNWLSISSLTSALAAIAVAVRIPLSAQILRPATQALGVASVLNLLAWVGMLGMTVTLLKNQPAPAAGAAQADITPFLVSVGLITLFAIVGLVSTIQGMRTTVATDAAPNAPTTTVPQPNYLAQVGPILFSCIAISIVGLAFAQFVPVTRPKPSVNGVSLKWDSEETRLMAQRACFDCHSNQTKWGWPSTIAPSSWLVFGNVGGGLEDINFDAVNEMPAHIAANTYKHFEEQMKTRLMPPPDYLIMHPEARLTDEENEKLLKGLQQTTLLTLPDQNK